jgi:hypothetical protein
MTPATIERLFARDRGQLSLDALAPPRAPQARAPRTAVPAPVVAAPAAATSTAAAPARPAPAGGTLDDLISGAWRELGAQRVAACPVCAEPMRPRPGARAGECGGCGTTLA